MKRREFLETIIAGSTMVALTGAESVEAKTVQDPNILFRAKTWSEFAKILPEVRAKFKADSVMAVFGYASLIVSHADIKPSDCKSAKLKNEKAKISGYEVTMNSYDVGANALRSTTAWREKGVYNVGIFPGLDKKDGAYTEGLNINFVGDDIDRALQALIERELGKAPKGLKIADLFDETKVGQFAALAGSKEDEFGLYEFQVMNTNVNGVVKPAVLLNDNAKYPARDLSPVQIAHCILDGYGATRMNSSKTNLLGGTSWQYFLNRMVEAYDRYDIKNPKIEEVREAIFIVAHTYKLMDDALKIELPDAKKDPKAYEVAEAAKEAEVRRIANVIGDWWPDEGKYAHKGPFTALFEPRAQTQQRDDTGTAWIKEFGVPRTAEEKFSYVAALMDKKVFDPHVPIPRR